MNTLKDEGSGFTFEPSDGVTAIEADMMKAHLELILEGNQRVYLSNPSISTLQRCRLASQIFNCSNFEVDFWTLASAVLEPASNVSLDTRFDLTSDCASYLRYQLERSGRNIFHYSETFLNPK